MLYLMIHLYLRHMIHMIHFLYILVFHGRFRVSLVVSLSIVMTLLVEIEKKV